MTLQAKLVTSGPYTESFQNVKPISGAEPGYGHAGVTHRPRVITHDDGGATAQSDGSRLRSFGTHRVLTLRLDLRRPRSNFFRFSAPPHYISSDTMGAGGPKRYHHPPESHAA